MKKIGTGRRNRATAPGENGTTEATARASEQNLSGDDAAFRRLLRRQRGGALERFLVEIEKGKKEECCAWWIFPTRDRGRNEPGGGTSVSSRTAPLLLLAAPPIWRRVLEAVIKRRSLLEAFPEIDLPRIHSFVKFWKTVGGLPFWFAQVLKRLKGMAA